MSSSLELYRAHNNLTQEELARSLNVTRLQIARWESGKHKPNKLIIELLKREKIYPQEIEPANRRSLLEPEVHKDAAEVFVIFFHAVVKRPNMPLIQKAQHCLF